MGRKPTAAGELGRGGNPGSGGDDCAAWRRRWRSFRSPRCLTEAEPGCVPPSRHPGPGGAAAREDSRAHVQLGKGCVVEQVLDRDGSGAMDRGEFETAMARFNIAAAPEVVDEIMRKYDSNGDGEIDYCEMLRALSPVCATASATPSRPCATCATSARATSPWRCRRHAPPLTPRRARPRRAADAPVSAPAFQKMPDWMRSAAAVAIVCQLFRQMDGDGDGRLDRDEWPRGLAMMNIHLTPEDLRAILARYDENGDGSIQFDELSLRVPEHQNPYQGNWQSIAHHDPKPANILPTSQGLYAVDFDNLLQRKIMSKADKMGSARQVFRELDYYRSGFVSPGEFRVGSPR